MRDQAFSSSEGSMAHHEKDRNKPEKQEKSEKPEESKDGEGSTGMGSEASEGLHSAAGHGTHEKSAVDRASENDDPGSEPLQHREDNPKGHYGGEGGAPRKPPPSH